MPFPTNEPYFIEKEGPFVWARTKFLSINPLPTITLSLFVGDGDPFSVFPELNGWSI